MVMSEIFVLPRRLRQFPEPTKPYVKIQLDNKEIIAIDR